MAKTFKTGVVITGDASGAVKATNLTKKQLGELNKKAKKTSTELADITKKAASWAAMAGGIAVAGTVAMINKQLGLIDSTAKVSDKLGIATESLTAMRVQAELTGVANNTLDMGLQRMVRRVAEAAEGTGEAKDALKELNLNAQELAKLAPDKQFAAIADAMEGVESQGQKVRLAFKLFDSEGVALVNTLKGGSAAAAEAQKFTEQWGLALTRVDAAKVEQANDEMHKLATASQGFWKQLTVRVAPAISGMAKEMLGFGAEAGTAQQQADKAFQAIAKGAGFVADMGRGLQVVWKGATAIVAQWYSTVVGAFAGVDKAMTALLNKLPERFGGGAFIESALLQGVSDSLSSTADQLSGELKALVEKAMPSELVKKKLKEWETASQKAAEKVAKAANISGKAYDQLAASQGVVSKQEEEYAKLIDKTVGSLSVQVDLLGRELVAVRNGKTATAAFNREKHIENALRSESAKKLLPEELARYRELVAQQYDLQQAVKEQADQATPYADAWEEATKRIDESFANAWKGAFDSFSDFADGIKNALKDLLANLAHQTLTKPILISLGLGGGSSSALAGGGGSGGGFNLSNLTSIFSGGGSLNPTSLLQGGGALAGINNTLGQVATSAMQFALDLGFEGAANFIGNVATNTAALPGGLAGGSLLTAGGAIVGGYAGNALGEAAFGKVAESNVGSTIGGTVGGLAGAASGAVLGMQLGAWAGPVGALIGAAVGALVDVIGGGDGKKRVNLGVSTGAIGTSGNDFGWQRGASGLGYQATTKRTGKEGKEFAQGLLDQFLAVDAGLTGLYNALGVDNIDLTHYELAGRSSEAGHGAGNFFGSADYNGINQEDLGNAADDFVKAWIDAVEEQTGTSLDITPIFDLANEGELLADTLTRVQTEFVVVQGTLDALGLTLLDTSIAGLTAADDLIKAYGSLENYVQVTTAIFQSAGQLIEQLAGMGNGQALGYLAANDPLIAMINERDRLLTEQQEKVAVQRSQVTEVDRLINTLQRSLGSLRIDSEQYDRFTRARAQQQLKSALGTNFTLDDIQGALSVVGRDAKHLFSSYQDYARDAGQTKGTVTALLAQAENEKSIAEKQLDALERIASSVGSGRIATLNREIDSTRQFNAAVSTPAGAAVNGVYNNLLGRDADLKGLLYFVNDLANGGQTIDAVRKSILDSNEYKTGVIPAFATGGAHAGGVRLVGENGPELEFTGPSQIYSNSQSRQMLDNSAVVTELKAVRAELEQLRSENKAAQLAIAKNTNKSAKQLGRWNGEGMPEIRA